MPKIQYQTFAFRKNSLTMIEHANKILEEYRTQGFVLTLRQLYYQFVSRDLIPNTLKSYKNLGSIINDGRMAGMIDWDMMEDRTRNLKTHSFWSSPSNIIASCAYSFRLDLWARQEYRPEVWIEKDALAGVFDPICTELRVPYFACKGYTSQSEMWTAGRRMRQHARQGQTPIVLHFGDHDPSGIDMSRDIQERLSVFAGQEIEVRRLALTMDQVNQYGPPPNPAKATDARFEDYQREYGNESWELDALTPTILAALVRAEIDTIRDDTVWGEDAEKEHNDRELLSKASTKWEELAEHLKTI